MKKIFYSLAFLLTTTIQSNAQCWQKITAGFGHTLAIKTDGTLWAWGLNNAGQLGDGTNNPSSIVPVQFSAGNNWQFISAGPEHSMAIKTDGTLWAWGRNSEAQLGDGTNNNSNVPVQIGTDNNWIAVSTGSEHTLAKKSNGTLWAWGGNTYGQCGNATPPNSVATPLQIGTATDWQTISTGSYHSIAIKTDGTAWGWGLNILGQLGDGTNTDKITPTQIDINTDWSQIASGWSYTLAIKTDGTLWAWGANNLGQLGDGSNTNNNAPIQIGTAANWQNITAGEGHSIAIKTDGSLWAWGSNQLGQLGDGTNTDINVPTQTGTATNWSVIDAGYNYTIGRKTNNSLWGWGNNNAGQLGDGTSSDRNIPVPISCGTTLPLTWLYVNGAWQNNAALIKWGTASESNTRHFEIEHSSNGINYSKVGTVAAAGNSSLNEHYEFLHRSTVDGKNYYRIKQIDLDGRFSYSSILSVTKTTEENKMVITPNPAQNYITLFLNKPNRNTQLRIINQQGQILLQQNLPLGTPQQSISISTLPSGIYSVVLSTNGEVKTIRFVKK